MSKGEIVGNKGEGLYTVRITYAVEAVKQEILQIEARLIEIGAELDVENQAIADKRQEADAVESQINALIPGLKDNRDEVMPKIIELQRALADLGAFISHLRYTRDNLLAERTNKRKRLDLLQSIPEDETMDAWCADFTQDLQGIVGLVDINDEGGQGVVIHPGFDGQAEYVPSLDGALMPRAAQSGAQVYFNAAILPGMQKWFPRYRVAEITSIDGDLCNIRLDEAESSAQGLDINRALDHTGVPIMYMDCNGAAFEVGDRVLVRFTSQGPLVIGFESEPKSCNLLQFCFEPSEHFEINFYTSGRRSWGQPLYDEEGTPINPPLGTLGGSSPVWSATPSEDTITIAKERPTRYGNRNWIGPNDLVLSWDGPAGRVFDNSSKFFNEGMEYPHQQWQSRWVSSSRVYKDMEVFFDLQNYQSVVDDYYIHGAAIHTDFNGTKWLYVIASAADFLVGQQYRSYRIVIGQEGSPVGEPEQLQQFIPDPDIGHLTGWYFNEAGTKAVCTFRRFAEDGNRRLWAVGRYDINFGFSYEVVYDRDALKVGVFAQDFDRVIDWDTENGIYDTTQDYTGSLNQDEYNQPIYCEYVGNKEVLVSLRIPRRQEANNYHYESFEDQDAGEFTVSSTQTIIETEEKPQAIVTSDGKTLFEFPQKTELSFSQTASEDNSTNTVTLNQSRQETQCTMEFGPGILSIDARFGFVAVGYYMEEVTSQASGSQQYETGANRYADFPGEYEISITEQIAVCLDGEVLDNVVLESIQYSESTIRFSSGRIMPNPDYTPPGQGSHSFSETEDVNASSSLIAANLNLLTVSGYKAVDKSVASLALWDDLRGRSQVILFSHLTGYPSVKVDLLNRAKDDPLVLHRVGII